MKNSIQLFLAFFLLLVNHVLVAQLDSVQKKFMVYRFEIHEEIMPPALKTTQDALKMAEKKNADLVVLSLDTYGGRVDIADEIRTAILESKIPVWVFIENNAASAGAFISIACDSIYMRPGSTIGATTVVDESGQKVGEKYQAFMRSRMRSTAEQKGRDPEIAEAMVEATHTIPGLVDSGQVVSLTAQEAILNGYCEGEYASVEAMLTGEGISSFDLVDHRQTAVSSIVRFFMMPGVSGLLVTIIILAIFFELKTPGLGIGTVVACAAAVLYFLPLYLEGLAAYWEIALFAVGIILLLLELLVIPGFGVAGVLGIGSIFFSLVLALVKAAPDSGPIPLPELDSFIRAFLTVTIGMMVAIGLVFTFAKSLLNSRLFEKVSVVTVQSRSDGYVATEVLPQSLIGKSGVSLTPLKPSGKIEIDGEEYDASVTLGYLEKDRRVMVMAIDNFILLVKPVV